MQNLAPDKQLDLLKRITKNLGMNALLDLLGQEIENLNIADGYIISLCDMTRENLFGLKLRYPEEFRFLESTYQGYKTNLSEDHSTPNARAFSAREVIRLSADSDADEDKNLLKSWELTEYVILPFVDAENAEQLPIGTTSLMRSNGKVEDEKIVVLNELLSIFYAPLQAAMQADFLSEFHENFKLAAEEHARALQFIVEINNLTTRRKISDLFSIEIFKRFNFDFIGFFLLEDDVLKSMMVSYSDAEYQPISEAWTSHFKKNHYRVDLQGGVSHAFMKNSPLVFPDVLEILHLPMAENDKVMIRMMKTPRTLALLPIRYQGKAIGVMTLWSLCKVVKISETDLHLLNTLSAFFGAAIINSDNIAAREKQSAEIERLNAILQGQVVELAEQAGTDRLTGLYNFRIFEREIERRISECKRTSANDDWSIVVFDVDHFKRFNDTYGHSAGNQVLIGVAREILKIVRKMDMAFRYGGEEFVVMMSKCTLARSRIFAERVRTAVEAACFETDAGNLSVTISAGCATYLQEDTSKTLFSRADQALYQAKNNGRNRIEG